MKLVHGLARRGDLANHGDHVYRIEGGIRERKLVDIRDPDFDVACSF